MLKQETTDVWYAIMCQDVKDSLERRLAARPAHIERLVNLRNEGRLLVAGPFPAIDAADPGAAGFSGSLIVADFESLNAAKEWAAADPYRHAGVYEAVSIKPFNAVLP